LATARLIVDELKQCKITHVAGLPDNFSSAIYDILREEEDIEVVSVSREGEAFAIAAGLYVGGKNPAVLIQNTGFLESGDAIRGTVINMKIPLITLIAYRGYQTLAFERERVDTSAAFLEPTLKAWRIPHYLLETDDDIKYISEAYQKAQENSMPVAILLAGKCT